MHSLMIGAGVFLMAAWLLVLPLRLAIDLRRVLHEPVRTLPDRRTAGALEAPADDVMRS